MKLIIETLKYFLLDFFFQKQKIQIINAIHIIDKILFNIKSPHQLLTSITFGRKLIRLISPNQYIVQPKRGCDSISLIALWFQNHGR